MHGSTLSEYWRNKKIPGGLRIQKAPTIGKSNIDFAKRWGEILNKCSLDLMLLIIEQVTTEAEELKSQIHAHEETMKQKFGDTFKEIEKSMKNIVVKYKEKLQATKIKKYRRDSEDYQKNEVYSWETTKQQLPKPAARAQLCTHTSTSAAVSQKTSNNWRQRARGDSSRDSDFTLDSDSSTPQSSGGSFLDNRSQQHR